MRESKEMPKFKFIETEEIERVIVFEAKDEIEAVDLMEDIMSVEDLPNVEIFHKSGTTHWGTAMEMRGE
jgi:hypothetical protein